MKILHVYRCLSPRSGGPVTVLNALARAQADAGHEVDICTTNRDPARGVFRPAGTEVVGEGRLRIHYFPVQVNIMTVSLQLALYIRQNIEDFDIVHVHGLYRFPATYAARRARKCNVPYVIRPLGSLDPFLYRQSSKSVFLKRLYERWFDLPNLHAAGAIHYTAEEERQRTRFLELRAASFVVPNGLDVARYVQLPERGAFRARLGAGDAPLVLFLGRLNFKKGLDLLVSAFAQLRQTNPQARLAIVGPDNEGYGKKVRGWIREHDLDNFVYLVEHLSGRQVVEAYVDADVFVLPSYTENFGMTVVEAMACATPVVISDRVNIHREIAGFGAGLVISCEAERVAAALSTILNDKGKAASMGDAGRRAAFERYAWPPIVDALTREYEAVIERTGSSRSVHGVHGR